MSNPEYHSAIYKINSNKEIGTLITFNNYNCTLLPKEIDCKELAKKQNTPKKNYQENYHQKIQVKISSFFLIFYF